MAVNIGSTLKDPKNILRLAISAACAGVPAVQAQAVLEEIIVTATKREANLQDLALSITAFTEAEIVRQGFKTFSDYVGQIPSLAVTERQPGATSVLMRGCAAQGLTFSDSATTSVYLDEQPITAAGYNPDPRLVDVARIEALGGPQGTLFGDAAQCGTLRVITNKADTTEAAGWINVTGMSVDGGDTGYDVSGMLNVPIIQDKLALRLVGFVADEPGYVDNVLSPSPGETFDNSAFVGDDVNSGTWYGGRASLRWNAAETWTVDANFIYQNYELDGFGDVDLNRQFYADTDTFPTLGKLDQIRFGADEWDDEWYQLSLTAEGSLGFADLTVTGAYFDRDSSYNADSTAYLQAFQQAGDYFRTYYNAYMNIYDFGGDPHANDFDGKETESMTIEARLSSPSDSTSRWGWLAGVFYNHREVNELFTANIPGLWDAEAGTTAGGYYLNYSVYNANAPSSARSNNWWTGSYDSELDQYAVFGEISFDVTDNFTVTAGGRWYDIENDYVVVQGALVGLNGGEPNIGSGPDCDTDYCYTGANDVGEGSEDGFVPKLNLSWSPWEDKMFYATYSEGFRRGGVNSARPQSIYGSVPGFGGDANAGRFKTYDADEVTNMEIGAKTEWFDNSLRINISAYKMEWDDIQVQAEDTLTGSFALGIVNLPEAEIYGADAWVAWAPTESIDIKGTLGWNKSEISKTFTLASQGQGDAGTETVISEGTVLPLMPDWKASMTMTYTFAGELFSATPYILANYVYWGKSINSLGIESSSFSFPVREQPDWQTLDLSVGLDSETWSASFYIDNVFNEYAQQFFNNRWAQQRLSINQPRTFGIDFRKYFGDFRKYLF